MERLIKLCAWLYFKLFRARKVRREATRSILKDIEWAKNQPVDKKFEAMSELEQLEHCLKKLNKQEE